MWRLFISAGVGRAVLGHETCSGALQTALGCGGEADEDGKVLLGSPATARPGAALCLQKGWHRPEVAARAVPSALP